MNTAKQLFEEKKCKLLQEFNTIKGTVSLKKSTSNLFRTRKVENKRINVKNFNTVLSVDPKNLVCDVEGMTTYEDLVAETLKYGCMPTVVPQLKTITIGGAVSGVGIEASSFKYGLVHETISEIEVLTGTGKIIIATPTNTYKDLFYGFPNSYGTLGYILRLKVKLVKVTPYVKLTHTKFEDSKSYFNAVNNACSKGRSAKSPGIIDFVDGSIFSSREYYLTTATFTSTLPKGITPSKYTYMHIFYKSIRKKGVDYLTIQDFIWRWDTDWFWCSKNMGAQNPIIRPFIKPWLNSRSYWKIMNFFSRTKILERYRKLVGIRKESIIQDIEVPITRAPEFIEFFQKEIGITPVWMCPTQAYNPSVSFPLYAMNTRTRYINFGFWDTKRTHFEDGYYNKLIEEKVEKLHGKKSLYSTSYYPEKKFWELYNKKSYDALKRKYDPYKRFKNLYEKTVLRR